MSAASLIRPYVWYPLAMGAAIAMFGWMLADDTPVAIALYASVVPIAFAVLWLQHRFPARSDWTPGRRDVTHDLAFMAVVQVLLPQALAASLALAVSASGGLAVAKGGWPHEWPLIAQICSMLLLVDFTRYWLHRACHRFDRLWRLHAVHHAPAILYALNSGRFHPLEKALHFCIDTAPFILLGVAPEVIAGYFLLYATNGLLQHSNVDLKYGWLNFVVGSAETHRWHHARDPRLPACNFGSTTVIWDLMFGTWHLPHDRHVEEVGIMERDYPTTFWGQMVEPFRGRHRDTALEAVKRAIANGLIKLHLRLDLLLQGLRIAAAVRNPMRVQHALLERILHANRDTSFGRSHGFANIGGYEDFARRVPVRDFEALRPFIDAEIVRGEHALTHESPTQYVRTSGSTGEPKDIPLTPKHLQSLRRIHGTTVAFQYRLCPEAFAGSILAIVSPAREGALASGKPFGSASGIVAGDTPALVRTKFVVPAEVFAIRDSRVKYLLILRLALAREDITYIGTANSTTLLALMTLYHEHRADLIEDLRRGTFFLAHRIPAALRPALCARLDACPDRAAALEQLHTLHPRTRIADLWPSLAAVVTWTCGSAGSAVDALRRELAARTRVFELGYIASEFRATITLGRRAGSGLPTLDTYFFEFVERDRWDRGDPEFLTLDRIRKGVDYYLVVTTPSGLYRYFINDIVRVSGRLHRTPLLRFVQKGKGVTSITGEKLYENQVLTAVRAALSDIGRALRFAVMLADETARHYRLYVESDEGPRPTAAALAEAVDRKLTRLNIEYGAKRESLRLGPIDGHWLRERAGEAFKDFCVSRGQREGQCKPPALAYRSGLAFDFDRFSASR